MKHDPDRVRRHTAKAVLRRIDDDTHARLTEAAEGGPAAIDARLRALDREWDTDRAVEVEAAAMGLIGLAVARAAGPRWLAWPAVVAGAVMMQALSGRYPWMPIFRRLGLRSAREIERERYALKALRGDFEALDGAADAMKVDPVAAATDVPSHGGTRPRDTQADEDARVPVRQPGELH